MTREWRERRNLKFDRRRIVTKTSFEQSKSDDRAVAVTIQGSSDEIREKAMRIASIDEFETGSSTARWSSPGGTDPDRTQKANEVVRSLVGITKKEEDIIVASGSNSKTVERHEFEASNTKLEHEICRHCEESRVSDTSVHQQ